jgi:peptide methionine sulfoxide reductase MsrB
MQNLAYKIETAYETPVDACHKSTDGADVCAACGEPLYDPNGANGAWQTWSTFWEIMGTSNVELVCGGCGEYLQKIFND